MDHTIGVLDGLPVAALLWDCHNSHVVHANALASEFLSEATGCEKGTGTAFTLTPSASLADLFREYKNSVRPLVPADVMLDNGQGVFLPLSGIMYYPYDSMDDLGESANLLVFVLTATLSNYIKYTLRSIDFDKKDLMADENSERFIHQILDAFPGMVFIKDIHGKYMACSDAFAKFLGLPSPDDIVGKTSKDVLPPASVDWAVRLDNLLFDKMQPSSEVYPFSMDGNTLTNWQRVTRTPLRNNSGELIGLVGVLENVGGMISLTEELTKAKANFLALSDAMAYNSFYIILWDVGSLDITYISENITYLGFNVNHFTNLNDWGQLVHPEDVSAFWAARQPLYQKKMGLNFWHEYRIINRHGDVRWMNEHISSITAPGSHLYRSMLIDTTMRHDQQHAFQNETNENAQYNNILLLDVVSLDYLQKQSDAVAKDLGVSSYIVDTNGVPLTNRDSLCTLCTQIRHTERGETLCHLSDVNIGIAARDAGGLIIEPCETLGLYTAAAPIMIGNTHLGTWIIGRVRVEDSPSEQNVVALAERLKLDTSLTLESLQTVPELNKEEITQRLSLLTPYIQAVLEHVEHNYMLMFETEKMVQSQETFTRAHDLDKIANELTQILFAMELDSNSRLDETFSVLRDYYGFTRTILLERMNFKFSLIHQSHSKTLSAIDDTDFSLSDMQPLLNLYDTPNTIVPLQIESLPETWRKFCSDNGINTLFLYAIENKGRPSAVILLSQNKPALAGDELYALAQLMRPISSFIMVARSERRILQTTDSLQSVINNMRSVVYVIDRYSYEVLFANNLFDGQSISGARGVSCFRLLGKSSPCSCCNLDMLEGQPDGYTYSYETNERTPNCWHAMSITTMTWQDNRPVYLVRARDITEERYRQEQLMYAATFDMLLDIPIIGRLNAHLGEILQDPENTGFLIVMDIDNVQLINNAYGHEYGDALMLDIVLYLKGEIPTGHFVYRYTTNTLAVLLENATQQEADDFVARLYTRFSLAWPIKGKRCFSTFSATMVSYSGANSTPISIMRDVDLGLRLSLDRGRNSFYVVTKAHQTNHEERLELANDLHEMVNDGCQSLLVYYQPIYSLKEQRITHCEALMRWQHPTKGLIPPLKFLEIAEDTALIVPLSEVLLDTVIRQCKHWRDNGLDLGVSVNFSAVHSRQAEIVSNIKVALENIGLPPSCLQLEISEALTINDSRHTAQFMKDLKSIGCVVALDNFGTGLSSLRALDTFSLDNIKIDRGFVNDLVSNAYHRELLHFMVNSASLLNVHITCEGVETTEQLAVLRELGVDYMQGFLLAKPMPESEMTAFLETPLPEMMQLP